MLHKKKNQFKKKIIVKRARLRIELNLQHQLTGS